MTKLDLLYKMEENLSESDLDIIIRFVSCISGNEVLVSTFIDDLKQEVDNKMNEALEEIQKQSDKLNFDFIKLRFEMQDKFLP